MNFSIRLVGSIFLLSVFSLSKLTSQCTIDWNYNGFNLQQTTFQMYYQAPNVAVAVPSPYYAYGAWMNDNVEDLTLPSNKDTDAWLHIAHDFGTASTPISNPYLFIYNWQSGILRTFFLITDRNDDYNEASVHLTFGDVGDNQKTAALSSLNGNRSINAIERFEIGKGLGMNKWENEGAYWLVSDFPIMYDPCTCLNDGLDSKIYIEAKLSKNVRLTATVNGSALQKFTDLSGQNTTTTGSLLKTPISALTKIAELQKERKEYKKLFEVVNGVSQTPSWANQLIGLAGPAGKFLALADFLMGILVPTPSSTPKPMAFEIELDATGQLNWEGGFQRVALEIPGTNASSSDPNAIGKNIADFNNVMGTFNLLKVPKVKMKSNVFEVYEDERCRMETHATQFQCTEPLKYVYQPFLGFLGNIKVEANFIIEFPYGTEVVTRSFPIGCFQDFKFLTLNSFGTSGLCWGIDYRPIGCKIQLFGSAGSGDKSIFLRSYNVDLEIESDVQETLIASTPSASCSDMSPASQSEINAVCGSGSYANSRDQASLKGKGITEKEYMADFERERAKRKGHKKAASVGNNLITVFPNPVSNSATVIIEITNAQTLNNLYLTDVSGKEVLNFAKKEILNAGKYDFKFERNQLAAGLYFIVLETDLGRTTQKIVLN